MKNFFICFVLLFVSCDQVSENNASPPAAPEDSKTQKINLAGGLGIVTVSLPLRYDTTFTWVHYSDCGKPCEKRKYRFQPKVLPVYPETGYYYKPLNDSIEQFTIIHNPYIATDDSDKTDNQSFITFFHDHKKFEITHDPALREIKWDTIEKIGDRYFSIIVIDRYDTVKAQYSKKLLSATTLRRGTIDFNFELLSRRKDSLTEKFIDKAKYYVRTIRIGSDSN